MNAVRVQAAVRRDLPRIPRVGGPLLRQGLGHIPHRSAMMVRRAGKNAFRLARNALTQACLSTATHHAFAVVSAA
ncbi:hypothetical protein [Flavisphingomonas formosensis]|uniref:hypothetical protein n=1 Tax=Flavisphingomonas formosensis TaxID=861534 RepID=UPI0018E05C10|nr:hypothetical protein [Sphingomonas formosensis]